MEWSPEPLPPSVKRTLGKRIQLSRYISSLTANRNKLKTLYLNHSLWALADQGLVSLGTFATNLILARTLPPGEYGLYVILFGVLLFLTSIQYAIITFPLTVKGATSDRDNLRRLASASLLSSFGLALILGAGMILAAKTVGRLQLAPWAVVALLFWQFQEVFRRALMAHQRYYDAMWGDALCYLGQAGLVLALSLSGHLSVQSAFVVIAVTSALAAVVQAIQLGLKSVTLRQACQVVKDFWRLGSWLLYNSLLGVFFTYLAFSWTLAYFHGLEEAAALQAVLNILGASHPVIFGMRGLIVPAVARANRESGKKAAYWVALGYALQGALLLLPFFALIVLWPKIILTTFYGQTSPYIHLETPLRLFAPAFTLLFLSVVLTSLLDGLEETRRALSAQLVSAFAFLIIGLPLVVWGGVTGASVGRNFYSLTLVIACLVILRKLKNGSGGFQLRKKLARGMTE